MTTLIDRMRTVFSSGKEFTSSQAIKASGIDSPTGRKIINRLREFGEIESMRETFPPRYRLIPEKTKTRDVSVPNIGTVEHAKSIAPTSIFDIGRL